MTSEVREFTIEQTSHRVLCATMKAAVKADALVIREHNTIKGKARDTDWQYKRNQLKDTARARHLIYGFVRGHDRARMESEKSRPTSSYYMSRVWKQTTTEVTKQFPEFKYDAEWITKYV